MSAFVREAAGSWSTIGEKEELCPARSRALHEKGGHPAERGGQTGNGGGAAESPSSLRALGMIAAAAGYLPTIGGAITQEIIDVVAVLNAVRVAIPGDELRDF